MENIPAQSETSHDVSHTCWRMSVHTHAQRLTIYHLMSTIATVLHSGCLKKMYVCYLVLELVCEVRTLCCFVFLKNDCHLTHLKLIHQKQASFKAVTTIQSNR